MTLEEYFFVINQPPSKEKTMLETLKNKWTEFKDKTFAFVDTPEVEKELQDYWAFYASTTAYDDISAKESFIKGAQDGTWMEILDQILDVLGHHYGYNIKEQVYYSVHFPLNIEGEAGYGRCLNDVVLQKLLLSYPEVYKTSKESFEI